MSALAIPLAAFVAAVLGLIVRRFMCHPKKGNTQ